MDLSSSYLGVKFEHPFILGSAPPTANGDMIRRAFEAGWAGAVVKTIIKDPLHQVDDRFAVLKSGNQVTGFENLELLSELRDEEWYREIASLKKDFPEKIVIASIMADARGDKDWISLAKGCQDSGADMVELNFSCPHGYPEKGRGAAIGQSAEYTSLIVSWIKNCKEIKLPIVVKLTAAVADIQYIAQAASDSGADGLCAINTIPSCFGIDLKKLHPKPDINGVTAYGGYSGRGIKPIALRAVSILSRSPGLPVMACGGISDGFDAAEFILLGAPIVQVCTEVMLRGYGIVKKMREDLEEFMRWHNFGCIKDFRGLCGNMVVPFSQLNTKIRYKALVSRESCARCGACYISCRDGGYQAISYEPGQIPVIDIKKCAGCSLCSHVCPVNAIQMKAIS